ncbi:MAG: formyltransferase family protein [bacterium]
MLKKKTHKIRLALFISGGATTACAIINACNANTLNIVPALVIASKNDIVGISRVIEAGMKKTDVVVIDPRQFDSPTSFAKKLISTCESRNINLIGQYGWLPMTPIRLINRFEGRIINQHPGPLDYGRPDFGGKGMYGRRVHCAVLYFRRNTNHDFWTEATAHLVTEQYDKGIVIGASPIPIEKYDTVESLQKKVLPIEHLVQINALKDFSEGKITKVKRLIPLIDKKEYFILKEAKKVADVLYPNG